jgi:hypothetical protein
MTSHDQSCFWQLRFWKVTALAFLTLAGTTPSQGNQEINLERFLQNNDPMPAIGKYAREHVENIQKRTLIFLNATEKTALGIPAQQVAFANFRHQKTFYVATIPGLNADSRNIPLFSEALISKVTLAKKHWSARTRPETKNLEVHAELLYSFKKGKGIQLLLNQDTKQRLSVRPLLKDVVLSIEAVRSRETFNAPYIPDGLGPHFAIAYRVVSLPERNEQHLDDPDRIVTQDVLDLSDTRSLWPEIARPEDALLFSALKASHDYARKGVYNAFLENCTNNLFKLMDETLSYRFSQGGSLDLNSLKIEIQKFVKTDLVEILAYLKKVSQTQEVLQSPAAQTSLGQLIQEIQIVSQQQALQLNLEEVAQPQTYLTQIPAFIRGHLLARGLIRP